MARLPAEIVPELRKWLAWADHPQTAVSSRNVSNSSRRPSMQTGNGMLWEGDEVVGTVGLTKPQSANVAVIGYWVRSDRTGRGYATAAARAVTSAAFDHLEEIQWVEIHMDQANRASAAIPPKLRYSLDREVEREVVAEAHTGFGYVWAVRRSEWKREGRP